MPDQKIVDYISSSLVAGFDRNKIRNDLLLNGSLPSEIDLAFNSLNLNPQSVNIPKPVVPPYSPANSVPVFTAETSKSSVFKKVLITVTVFVLIGGISTSAYFGYNYYKSSQITLGGAVLNTIEALTDNKIKSGEFSLIAEITAKDVGKNYSDLATDPTSKQITDQLQNVAVNLTYSGIVNKISDDKFETSGDLSASIKNPDGGSLGMFGSQEVALKYKTFSDNIYLNVQKIPSLASMIIPANIDTAKYLNQWFSMPTAMTTEYSKSYTDAMGTTTIPDYVKKQIMSIFDESGAFTVVDKKAEKTDKGTAVTAFYLKIDWDKLGDEIIRLSKEDDKTAFTKSQEIEIRANIEKFKELPVNNSVLKIFVGADGYVHGYVSTGDLLDKTNKQIGSYKLSFVADSFNQSFTIDRPANARSLTEAVAEIMSLMNTTSGMASQSPITTTKNNAKTASPAKSSGWRSN